MLQRAAKAAKAPVWDEASRMLSRPSGLKVEVNVGRLSKMAREGRVFLVPGKVLGSGTLEKKVVVGAFSFSAAAKRKIADKGGSAMTLEEFLKKYPKGSDVRIVE